MGRMSDAMNRKGHDRAIVYCSIAKDEVGIPNLAEQERLCREDAAEHDAVVVGVIQEELRHADIFVPFRPGLIGALRRVSGLRKRGVLLAVGPDRLGSASDQAIVRRLVQDAGGCVETVGPGYPDRITRWRVHEVMTAISLYEQAAGEVKDDSMVLRRAQRWPFDSGSKEGE